MLSIRELRDRAVIRPIKRAVEDQLLDLPGVTAVDIGAKRVSGRCTGEQAIVVSVARKKPGEHLGRGQSVPADVLGIPTDVIEERPTLHHLHRDVAEAAPSRPRRGGRCCVVRGGGGIAPRRSVRLFPPDVGASGQYRRIGTMGVLVTAHHPNMVTMGLTTFDVACLDDGWSVGDTMVDPNAGRVYADLARAALSGRVDAAAVAIGTRIEHSCVIDGIGPVTGQCTAYPGEVVRKNGFGTGLTTGVVRSTDTTVRVDHGASLGVRVLREQVRVAAATPNSRFAADGDSGAAVVNTDGRVVGLHVASARDGATGFVCPIGDVLAELDVELCVEEHSLPV